MYRLCRPALITPGEDFLVSECTASLSAVPVSPVPTRAQVLTTEYSLSGSVSPSVQGVPRRSALPLPKLLGRIVVRQSVELTLGSRPA